MSNPKWVQERQYWIDAKEGTFIGWIFENQNLNRDLCMWFTEVPEFQKASTAEDLKECMRSHSRNIFDERDFDKVDQANKKYHQQLNQDTQN